MLYKKVLRDLRGRINSGEFDNVDKLPTEPALMTHYNVSRITIRNAIDELVKLGLVIRRQGAGTFVVKKEVSHTIHSLRSTGEYMKEINKPVYYQVIKFSMIIADNLLARNLQLAEGDELYYIRRVKIIDEQPCIVEDSFMPVHLFPDLNISTLRRSKYDYVEQDKGMQIEGSHQQVFAVMPDQQLTELLQLNKKEPLLKLTSLSNLKDGTPFDYSIAWFKPQLYDLSFYLRRNVDENANMSRDIVFKPQPGNSSLK